MRYIIWIIILVIIIYLLMSPNKEKFTGCHPGYSAEYPVEYPRWGRTPWGRLQRNLGISTGWSWGRNWNYNRNYWW